MAENPFLLPPGSTPPATPEPTIVPRVTPPTRDPDRYIAIPPSIESATHRIARLNSEPHSDPPSETDSEPHLDPVAEETRLAIIPITTAALMWSIVLPDGSRVAVDGPILLGRDPAPPADRADARPVPLDDPGKTVSKTHVLLEPSGAGSRGIRVQDLHSTNGVAITSGGIRAVLAPGTDGVAAIGALIELGSFTLLVDAR